MKISKKSLWMSVLLGSTPIWACNGSHVLGAGGSGAVYTMSADTMKEGDFYLGINAERVSNKRLSDTQILHALEEGSEHIHSIDALNTYGLSLSYGLRDDLTLNVNLPYSTRKNIRAGEDHHEHLSIHAHEEGEVHSHGDSNGVGDLSAILQYKVYDDKVLQLALLAGIKAPTGKTDVSDDGELLETDLQPGSGSWDYFAGAALSRNFDDFSLHGSILYKYTTENDEGVTLGDIFNYNVAWSYKLKEVHQHGFQEKHDAHAEPLDFSVDFFVELNGEYAYTDENHGLDIENTGHSILYATTGLQLLGDDGYSAFVAVGVPVYQHNNGLQNDVKYKATIGLGKSF